MSSDKTAAVDVFFSYSHRDQALRDALETHLALLKREGAIRTWHDRRIDAGQEWQGEIDRHLESADLVLLLISPDFIASDYCFDREMGRALERHRAGEARVVPVILRPADWQAAVFAQLQALPRTGKAITIWPNQDEAFVDVVRGLRTVVTELHPTRKGEALEATPPMPKYPDDTTRELAQSLEAAHRHKAQLSAKGMNTRETVEEILALRRRLRQGAQLKAGDFLSEDRFQLLEEIGHGGFAQVWKAYDQQSQTEVAVKVLHGQHTGDRSRRERFFRGARHMTLLEHPNVVRVIERKCQDGEYCFFVMEYLRGGDFRHAVLENRLSLHERLQIVIEVGDALTLAHGNRVIHRDVKPPNILLASDGSPKLTDFDLVRAADTTGGTRTAMLGTFLYASPEAMLDASKAAEPADVYGLGMTAIFALLGVDLPSDVLWELPELVATLEVSHECRQVLLRAVERKVDQRWATESPGQPEPGYWHDKNFNQPEQPVVGVSWPDSKAYCRWAGLELPTEAQWEAAARGKTRRSFPWGEDPPSETRANYDGRVDHTTPVSAYLEGAGPYGTLDQAGNAWEWCRDELDSHEYRSHKSKKNATGESSKNANRVLRGGALDNPSWVLHTATRLLRSEATGRLQRFGFRVCLPSKS